MFAGNPHRMLLSLFHRKNSEFERKPDHFRFADDTERRTQTDVIKGYLPISDRTQKASVKLRNVCDPPDVICLAAEAAEDAG